MGIMQAIAILPGISRSGATISIAVFFKIDKKSAAEFSFLMVLFPIMGIMFLELIYIKHSNTVLSYLEIKTLLIAFFSAFFSGLIACKYMINVVEKNRLPYFGYYCFIIAIFFLIYS
jgi:undecaprenyl-diphosphatase